MKKFCVSFLFLLISIFVFSNDMYLIDQGGKGIAKSGMVVASTNSGIALYYNPAGLANVNTRDLELNASLILPNLSYSSQDGTKYDAAKKGNIPVSIFYTHPLNEKITLALGITTPVFKNDQWENSFPGRFFTSQYEIRTNELSLGLGYKLTEKINVGFSVDYSSTYLKFSNFFKSPYYDYLTGTDELIGYFEVKGGIDDTQTDTGFTVGIQYNFLPKWTLGFSYKTEKDFDFKNVPVSFEQITEVGFSNAEESFNRLFGNLNETLTTKFQIPSQFAIGVAYRPTNRWLIEVDYLSLSTSDNDVINFDYSINNDSIIDRGYSKKWDDMSLYGFSLEYTATKKIKIMGAMRYGSDVIPLDDWHPAVANGEMFWISLGISYLDQGNGFEFAMFFKNYKDYVVSGQEYTFSPIGEGYLELLQDATGKYDRNFVGFTYSYHIRF
ncbi:long-chain fatty acid transport protein [Thermotomaculum hydrothermale]|uniref:Long-chain fatty acid transport protein n=1 Tax=Thermotomaculum hydrothermale TaxID=981385 RepID=A0A7R6PLS5_9BACT|nr:outer membrane protein transport protein [Thermotomaculum hydrothermale]BBB32437.1 long-chain fatty acid transport protein [Thermotomaculum hydrothermale]